MLVSIANLYEKTYIDLICDLSVSEVFGIEVNISITWTAHDSNGESIQIGGDEYKVTDQTYNSTLRIGQLNISRDNMAVYSCLVNLTPSSGALYVNGSESYMDDITLTVKGKFVYR